MSGKVLFVGGKPLIRNGKVSLSTACCCDKCTVCLETFGTQTGETAFPYSNCAYTYSGDVRVIDGTLHMASGSVVAGNPASVGQRLIVRASGEVGALLTLQLGPNLVGVLGFGDAGTISVSGGLKGIVIEPCGAAASPTTLVLCLGHVDNDPNKPGVAFIAGGCHVSDELPAEYLGTEGALSIGVSQGAVVIESIQLQRGLSESRPGCKDCQADPEDPECLVCSENFDRPDNADITVNQTCVMSGGPGSSIYNNQLRLDDGDATFPAGDYVKFSVLATEPSTVQVSIGGAIASITIGNDSTTISLNDGGTPPITYDSMYVGGRHSFVMCIGPVSAYWGVSLHDANDPQQMVSTQFGGLISRDNPPHTPYGPIKFDVSGDVLIDEVRIYVRKTTDNPECFECSPQICGICADAPAYVNVTTTSCLWTGGSFETSPGSQHLLIGPAQSHATSGVPNPAGQPHLVFAFQCNSSAFQAGDEYWVAVGTNSGGANGIQAVTVWGDDPIKHCFELRQNNQVLTRYPGGSGFVTIWHDGSDVYASAGGHVLTMSSVPTAGGYVAFGAVLQAGSFLSADGGQVGWYAYPAFHKHCAASALTCDIFATGFPYSAAALPLMTASEDAGDPDGATACHLEFTPGWHQHTWFVAALVPGWYAIVPSLSVTMLTTHPSVAGSTNFTGVISWIAFAGASTADFNVAQSLSGLHILYNYGDGLAIKVEFVGCTTHPQSLLLAKPVVFYEISVGGGGAGMGVCLSGIVAIRVHIANPSGTGGGVWACFGNSRVLVNCSGVIGKTSFPAVAGTDGKKIGVEMGDAFFGSNVFGSGVLGVLQGISLSHSKATAPQNKFSGVPPAECVDCDGHNCEACEDTTPGQVTVSITKTGGWPAAQCPQDQAKLSGSFVLGTVSGGCSWGLYIGPAKGGVAAFCAEVYNMAVFTDDFFCGMYVAITAEIVLGNTVRVVFHSATADWLDLIFTGTLPPLIVDGEPAGYQCANLSLTLEAAPDSLAAGFDVTFET